jgi:hypothetical protein
MSIYLLQEIYGLQCVTNIAARKSPGDAAHAEDSPLDPARPPRRCGAPCVSCPLRRLSAHGSLCSPWRGPCSPARPQAERLTHTRRTLSCIWVVFENQRVLRTTRGTRVRQVKCVRAMVGVWRVPARCPAGARGPPWFPDNTLGKPRGHGTGHDNKAPGSPRHAGGAMAGRRLRHHSVRPVRATPRCRSGDRTAACRPQRSR